MQTPTANIIELFCLEFMKFLNKLECLSPGKLFQPSPMFVGKAGNFPSKAFFRCSTLGQVSGLTHKHQTRLEGLSTDFSLLQKSVNYRQKSFITLTPGDNLAVPDWSSHSCIEKPVNTIDNQFNRIPFKKTACHFVYIHLNWQPIYMQ